MHDILHLYIVMQRWFVRPNIHVHCLSKDGSGYVAFLSMQSFETTHILWNLICPQFHTRIHKCSKRTLPAVSAAGGARYAFGHYSEICTTLCLNRINQIMQNILIWQNVMHYTEQLQNNRTMHKVLVSAECSDFQLHNIRLLPNIENSVSVSP